MKLRNGIFIGLLIGIFSALLYAPKSGKEIRKEVQEKINLIPKNFFSLLESIMDLSVSVLDFAKEAFGEQKDKFSNAVNKGISAAKNKADELKHLTSSVISH